MTLRPAASDPGARDSVTVDAHAKINLELRITAVRPDGFHEIETVFQSLELHDTLRCERREGPLAIECRESWYTTSRFAPLSAAISRLVWMSGDNSSDSPARQRYGAVMRSACPSQVIVFRKWSNSVSSSIPLMYMKRILKVGDASSKIVWKPGS